MKTIIARFEDMKKDPMAILEDGVSANKVEAALATIGIALRNSEGEFRALQDVMDELGMKWNSLTRNQQAYIATVAAGSRQQSRFLALMNNYDRTLDLIAESQNSAGAAAQQYAVYQDSAAAATARLTAAWEEFYSKIVSSETIIFVINSLTKLVETMSKVGPAVSAIGASITALGLQTVIKSTLPNITKEIAKTATEGQIASISIKNLGSVIKNSSLSFGLLTLKVLGVVTAITAAIAAITLLIKAIKANNNANENELKRLTKINKERKKEIKELKEQKQKNEDNYEIYKKYKDKIVLTSEELEEQNNAVDQLKESNKNILVITDEIGRKTIYNTHLIEEQNEIDKERIKTLEKEAALAKITATERTETAKRKYGEESREYRKDWTEEQLQIAGYTEEESKILDQYGEFFRNEEKRSTSIKEAIFSSIFKNIPNSTDSLFGQIAKEYSDRTGERIINSFGPEENQYIELLQNGTLEEISSMLKEIEKEYDNANPKAKIFFDIIYEKGELAIQALEILNNKTKDYGESLLNINIDQITDDAIFSNDFSNLFNNLSSFNNGEYLKQFENKTIEEVEDTTNKIIENIKDNWEDLAPDGQKAFHELVKQLLDPSLSPSEKEKLITEFENTYDDIEGELEKIVNQYIEGSNTEINKRKKLSESLGINEKDLRDYSSKQLKIIDQLRTSNKTDFNFGAYILTDTGEQMIDALSTLDKDITEDPTIYKKAQDIMVDFFMTNFEMDKSKALDTFQAIFGNIPEAVVSAAKEKFLTAKENLSLDSTESLTDEQLSNLESSLGESLRYYVEINDEGEKYLTIAGKIAVFDKQAQEYRNALIAESQNWITQLEEIEATNKDISDEQAKQVKNLKRDIELNNEKIEKLEEIQKYTAQITAESSNISRANTYNTNLKTFKQAEEEMKKYNGKINADTASAIMKMDASYSQYLDKRLEGEGYYYTLSTDNLKKLRGEEKKSYNDWVEQQKLKLTNRIEELQAELEYYTDIAETEGDISKVVNEEELDNNIKKTDKIIEDAESTLEEKVEGEEDTNQEILNGALDTAKQFEEIWSKTYDSMATKWNIIAEAMKAGEPIGSNEKAKILNTKPNYVGNKAQNLIGPKLEKSTNNTNNKNEQDISQSDRIREKARTQIERIKAAIERLQKARDSLVPLGPELEDTASGAGKTAEEMEKLTDVLKDCAEALEKLDDILKDLKEQMQDINVDYNPFTDLFEAWEHEWDYYYNIKRLISQIGKQGEFINNIISADYSTADEKLEGYQAKVGNIMAKMSANDAYLLALRAGMAQTGKELMEQYGEYYKIDPETGQIYQTDKNLKEINDTINTEKQKIYDLEKEKNIKENDLALEEAKLNALEEQKSSYESILSEIESQIDNYDNLEDVVANISELEGQRETIKLKIEVTEESISEQKNKIQNIEDEIDELEVKITIEENNLDQMEDFVDDMEDKLAKYEEYWDLVNEEIINQQELLQELAEIQNYYIDTAISTEQELYDAIVANYQKEIDKKKSQYDYLKQLDSDYLASVKENINKERQARDDAKNQKSYQQSLQRLQLLQQDTSGAYRSEIAQLSQEIEGTRQDLYDDLVDKQVDALEKEIEKRHELYDKEVAALEERLAYMQENAILLWEMVNEIVAGGSEEMMALLENTTDYINSNELSREKQRKQWEENIKATYKGVVDNEIENIEKRIEKGKEYVESLKEFKTAIEKNTETYKNSTEILVENDENFQSAMDAYMTQWNIMTSDMTGYHKDWKENVNVLKTALEADIKAISDMNNTGGSIKILDEKLRQSANDMYDDFIAERTRYRDELTKVINQIQDEIGAAVSAAASAIRSAASSAQYVPSSNSSGTPGNSGTPSNNETSNNSNTNSGSDELRGWTATFSRGDGTASFSSTYRSPNPVSEDFLYNNWLTFLNNLRAKYPNATSWGYQTYNFGGIADFTGPAWLDGTPSQPERILSPRQTKLFESMVSSLEKSTNSNVNSSFGSSYNIGDINTTIQVQKLDNETDINKLVKQVEEKIVKSIRNRVVVSV